jgi:two-component system, NarL family, response regulator DevR
VFLLDDHEIVRRGLRELLELEEDIEVVGESGSAQEATQRIPALRPDVAPLDARLPDGSGMVKDVRGNDLVASIRRVAAGECLIDERRRASLRERWDAEGRNDPRLAALSPQERRILQHIADGLTNR